MTTMDRDEPQPGMIENFNDRLPKAGTALAEAIRMVVALQYMQATRKE